MQKIDPQIRIQLKGYKKQIRKLQKKRDRLWWKEARGLIGIRKIIFKLIGV